MLVLTRKSEESVIVGSTIEIKILGIKGDQVSLGFQAPKNISIYRKEIFKAIQDENREASRGQNDIESIFSILGRPFFQGANLNKEV